MVSFVVRQSAVAVGRGRGVGTQVKRETKFRTHVSGAGVLLHKTTRESKAEKLAAVQEK